MNIASAKAASKMVLQARWCCPWVFLCHMATLYMRLHLDLCCASMFHLLQSLTEVAGDQALQESISCDLVAQSGCCAQVGGEGVLAMELWWRCAALEALQAYVISQLALCTRQEGIKMQKTVASLLQPTLDAIMASPVLQVMAHDTSFVLLLLAQ